MISRSRMMAMRFLTFSLAIVATVTASRVVYAGECKVSEPTKDLLTDAWEMAKLNEAYLSIRADQFREKTGKELKIVIIARAGQDFSDQAVLRDLDSRGRAISVEDMMKAAQSDPASYRSQGEGGQVFDFDLFKDSIRRRYKDQKRSMEFSHLGFMIRRHPKAVQPADKRSEPWWWTRHMLRPCENKNAQTAEQKMMQQDLNRPWLHDEGPINFFADDPYLLKARVLIPSPELQDRLLEAVLDDELVYKLNSTYYNAAAVWTSAKESNSNQWVLEMLAAAMRPKSQVQNRKDAQEVLARHGYRPSRVLFAGQKAMANIPGARLFAPFVTYHSSEQPYYFKASIGDVISALSVEEFMELNGVLQSAYTVVGPDKFTVRQAKAKKGSFP